MRLMNLMLILAAAACTSPAPQPPASMPDSQAVGGVVLIGVPRVVGSAPVNTRLVLADASGRQTEVVGPLAPEIRQLDGAQIEVSGRMTRGSLEASGYRIRSVDGRPVEMGTVERSPDGGVQLRKADGSVVRLTGAASQLRVGQKVWVQGPTTAAVQVQTFGVINP